MAVEIFEGLVGGADHTHLVIEAQFSVFEGTVMPRARREDCQVTVGLYPGLELTQAAPGAETVGLAARSLDVEERHIAVKIAADLLALVADEGHALVELRLDLLQIEASLFGTRIAPVLA